MLGSCWRRLGMPPVPPWTGCPCTQHTSYKLWSAVLGSKQLMQCLASEVPDRITDTCVPSLDCGCACCCVYSCVQQACVPLIFLRTHAFPLAQVCVVDICWSWFYIVNACGGSCNSSLYETSCRQSRSITHSVLMSSRLQSCLPLP